MSDSEQTSPRVVPDQGLRYKPPSGYSPSPIEIFHNKNAIALCSRWQLTRKGLENWKWGNQLPEFFMRSEKFLLESLKTPSCEVCPFCIVDTSVFTGTVEFRTSHLTFSIRITASAFNKLGIDRRLKAFPS
jgi:hypothetical protein